ncbi:MAG: phage portal protein [Lachnospiraceae bacterium]|nr:phage portal protein [Lachnospiraceae bacterium]
MRNPFKKRSRSSIGILIGQEEEGLCVQGYTSLDKNPEIMTACRSIAELIGTITIHLMMNTPDGDVRIENELSRMIDITPMPYMTRKAWMESIVMNLLLYGKGNAVVLPHTRAGYLRELEPIAADRVSFVPIGYSDYQVWIDGKAFRPDDVLHFTYNPDKLYLWKGQGINVSLKSIADNLKQAEATKKGFLQSKWKPSIIVKVDAMNDSFSDPEKRKKMLQEYVQTEGAGEPWVIPGEQIDVKEIRPLTLADLAISDTVEIDKKTVAAVIGVPPFLLGVGDYDQEAWNNFVRTKVRAIVTEIAQEMTRKLIISPDWYLRFNELSLLDWDLQTIANVYGELRKQGIVDGNEVRDRIGMGPREGLNELVMLENYIPADRLGDQNKLNGGTQ